MVGQILRQEIVAPMLVGLTEAFVNTNSQNQGGPFAQEIGSQAQGPP